MKRMYVYITTNPGRTTLYVGVTNSLCRRLREHWEKRGTNSSFAGRFRCYNLVYFEEYRRPITAIQREKAIKGLRRRRKENLINAVNPDWTFLPWWEWTDETTPSFSL